MLRSILFIIIMMVVVLALAFMAAIVVVMAVTSFFLIVIFTAVSIAGSICLAADGTGRRSCRSGRGGIVVAADGCTGCAANGSAYDCAIFAADLVTDGGTCAAANCSTHNSAAVHRICHRRKRQQRQDQISQFHHYFPPNR